MMKKILLALFLVTIFLFGCAKQPLTEIEPEELSQPVEEIEEPVEVISEPIVKKETKAMLNLLVSDNENVIADFDSVEVTFNLAKIYKVKDSVPIEKKINVVADLTDLQNDIALKILETELDPGSYSKIKLYASNVKGVLLGNEVDIIISGDSLAAERAFEIKSGELKNFIVDLEIVKTGKVTTTTRLEEYKLQVVQVKSGLTSPNLFKEITAAEMVAKLNEKLGKKFDKHIFLTEEEGFTPPEITIETGTKVIWENKDAKKLGIIMAGGFNEFIRSGGSYTHTFNRIGTFPYNMKYYVSNAGKITVISDSEEVEEEKKIISSVKSVEIKSTGFSPSELSIKRGTKVTFTNKDTKYHHIVIEGADLKTYALAPNEVLSYTYNDIGEQSFYDAYNVGDYSGKVIVS